MDHTVTVLYHKLLLGLWGANHIMVSLWCFWFRGGISRRTKMMWMEYITDLLWRFYIHESHTA